MSKGKQLDGQAQTLTLRLDSFRWACQGFTCGALEGPIVLPFAVD